MPLVCDSPPLAYRLSLKADASARTAEECPAQRAERIAGYLANPDPSVLGARAHALIGLAALTAIKGPAVQIRAHVRDALAAGSSREEIVATIVEAALHAGFAAAQAGLEAAFVQFAEADATPEGATDALCPVAR
jgi:alkylhydroperoxidase/carboxymuconolactone decarboxylase family protein YurZ